MDYKKYTEEKNKMAIKQGGLRIVIKNGGNGKIIGFVYGRDSDDDEWWEEDQIVLSYKENLFSQVDWDGSSFVGVKLSSKILENLEFSGFCRGTKEQVFEGKNGYFNYRFSGGKVEYTMFNEEDIPVGPDEQVFDNLFEIASVNPWKSPW